MTTYYQYTLILMSQCILFLSFAIKTQLSKQSRAVLTQSYQNYFHGAVARTKTEINNFNKYFD